MGDIRFCVCGCQLENPFVCFGTKPTQRAWVWDLKGDRTWTREGRSDRSKKKWVSRREQMRSVGLREQSREGEGINARKWVNFSSGFVEVLRKYTPAIACKFTESCTKVSQTSLLRFELTHVRVCSFVLFFHPLVCALWVGKEKCNVAGRRWEKPLDDLI